jgi:hypothetical protein
MLVYAPQAPPGIHLLYCRGFLADDAMLGEECSYRGIQPTMHLFGDVIRASHRCCNHGGVTWGTCEAMAQMQYSVGNTRRLHPTNVIS